MFWSSTSGVVCLLHRGDLGFLCVLSMWLETHLSLSWHHQPLGDICWEKGGIYAGLLDKTKTKLHVASSTEEEYSIRLSAFVLPLPLKTGKGESEINKSKNTYMVYIYIKGLNGKENRNF